MTELYAGLLFEFVPGQVREGRQCCRLLRDWTIRGITIPAGFVTDWASVPWWLDGFVPSFGPYAPATIPHDYLYSVGGVLPCGDAFTRKQVDDLFLDLLKELGVSWAKRSAMYRAVRLGGGSGWNKRD